MPVFIFVHDEDVVQNKKVSNSFQLIMSFLDCPLIASFIYHFFMLLIFFNLILLRFSFLHLDDQIVNAFHFGKFHLFHKMVQQLGSECRDLLNIGVKNLMILFDFFQKN